MQLAAEAATGFDFPYDGPWLASMSNLIDAAATVQDPASARTLVERVGALRNPSSQSVESR